MAAMKKCDVCGGIMSEGFCIHDGEAYYCSEECLHEHFTEEEYEEMYENDEAYWTQWEEEEEIPSTMLRVCYKEPGKDIQIREISAANCISALQVLVGGYIELVRAWSKGVVILADEEGLIKRKPYNCMGLVGPIVFIGTSGSNFRSLTDKEIVDIMYKEGRYETAD